MSYAPLLDKQHFTKHAYQLKLLNHDVRAINNYLDVNKSALNCLESRLLLHNLVIELLLNNNLLIKTDRKEVEQLLSAVVPLITSEYGKIIEILNNAYRLAEVDSYYIFTKDTKYLGKSIYETVHQRSFDINYYPTSELLVNTICEFLNYCDQDALIKLTLDQVKFANELINKIKKYRRTSKQVKQSHIDKIKKVSHDEKQENLKQNTDLLNENAFKTTVINRIQGLHFHL